jgi:hypothetical protein
MITQKTPKTTVWVIDEASRKPVIASVERKYYAKEDFKALGSTDANGLIFIPATYHLMPIPHTKLPVGMMLRVEAAGYQAAELEIWGLKKDVEIALKKEKGA